MTFDFQNIDTLVILGSGMSDCYMPDEYEVVDESASGVVGHAGRLVLLRHGVHAVQASLGRRHLYEGLAMEEVQGIIYRGWELGARNLIVANAAGGIDPRFQAGDIMLIDDYLGSMLGRKIERAGKEKKGANNTHGIFYSRHRDGGAFATEIYPAIEHAMLKRGQALRRGVYAGVLGPSYETRAEIRMLRRMGASAVGMSTIPEVTAAWDMGMRIIGLSLIANVLTDSTRVPLDHLDVVEQGRLAQRRMRIAIDTALDLL